MTPQVSIKEAFDTQSNELSFTDRVIVAEALWATSVAVCHLPLNVSNTIVPTFTSMFPDSKIAAAMECQRIKTGRILSDGLGPHFKEVIENNVRNNAVAYTIEIDETTTAKHWR